MAGPIDPRLAALGKGPLDGFEIFHPLVEAGHGDVRRHIGHFLKRVAGLERIVFIAEEAAAAGPLVGQDGNVPRNFRLADRQLVAANGPDRRVHHGRIGPIAGLHEIGAAFVIAFLTDQRADQGDGFHLFREVAETLGQLNALGRGGNGPGAAGDFGPRMGVERLQLTRPPAQPQQNDRLGRLTFALFRLLGQQVPQRREPADAAQPGPFQPVTAIERRTMRVAAKKFHDGLHLGGLTTGVLFPLPGDRQAGFVRPFPPFVIGGPGRRYRRLSSVANARFRPLQSGRHWQKLEKTVSILVSMRGRCAVMQE